MPLPPPKKKVGPPPPKSAQPRKAHTIHIQRDLIAPESSVADSKYTGKILAPIYEPKNKRPDIFQLVDQSKAKSLLKKICESNVPKDEMAFLVMAAYRHNIFNYKLIADYYAHASAEMQDLMEQSALVIIDFDKAIQGGYIKFSEEIKKLYVEEYDKQK